jgi:hypothetical protein
MGFRLRHRARTRLLGGLVTLNWAQGRMSSVSVRVGPFTWNTRRRGVVRTDLPGGFHGEFGPRGRRQR